MGKMCPRCGTENDIKAKFCMNCGFGFTDNQGDANNGDKDITDSVNGKANAQEGDIGETGQGMASNPSQPFSELPVITEATLEDEPNYPDQRKRKKKKGNRAKIIAIVIAAIVIGLFVYISTRPKPVSIEAEYDGETTEGVVLDSDNDGFSVTITYDDGSQEETADWEIEEPVTLEVNETSTVTVSYGGMTSDVEVPCSTVTVERIKAKYVGSTEAGTVIDENSTDDIKVTAFYGNGEKEKVQGWTMDHAMKLEVGKTSKATISYYGAECTLKVRCTTLDKEAFKKECQSIPYDNLARDPDKYSGEFVKFTGEIMQVIEQDSYDSVGLLVNVTNDGYGYYDDTVYVYYTYHDGESLFLEDDMVTFYGAYMELYTYKSVMGASITVPQVLALVVERN